MNKKLFILIPCCFTLSLLFVFILFVASGQLKDQRGSFLRMFPPHPMMEGDSLSIRFNSYYIAGGTPDVFYLGNYSTPLRLLQVAIHTLDTVDVRLTIDGLGHTKFWAPRVQVDYPNYYFSDGTLPVIYKGETQHWKSENFLSDTIFFREFVPLSNRSIAVRSLSATNGENILGKVEPLNSYHYFNDSILEKQQDGIFCTDGMLRYNREFNKLVYLYYYRNQFMVMDSSVRLSYRGHTIDTTSVAKIKTASDSKNTKLLSSPALFVNRSFDTAGKWIFVNSALIAKNEHPDISKEATVIDCYELATGKYEFSFYIYHLYGRKKLSEFRVFGDYLIARHDDVIRKYYLKPEYFRPKVNEEIKTHFMDGR